ncbi:hypothetical protein E4U53_005477 [Claviceps sorghi]|nr:hypothetical protein E4U53_005477 [Claviceps sorghi]
MDRGPWTVAVVVQVAGHARELQVHTSGDAGIGTAVFQTPVRVSLSEILLLRMSRRLVPQQQDFYSAPRAELYLMALSSLLCQGPETERTADILLRPNPQPRSSRRPDAGREGGGEAGPASIILRPLFRRAGTVSFEPSTRVTQAIERAMVRLFLLALSANGTTPRGMYTMNELIPFRAAWGPARASPDVLHIFQLGVRGESIPQAGKSALPGLLVARAPEPDHWVVIHPPP